MKERPILFNGEMVRAILDGRKTMTRRPVKPQPGPLGIHPAMRVQMAENPPLGTIGDRLWVRETFRIYNSASECACYDECKCASVNGKPLYRASDPSPDDDKWTPSIHMPRWASRITLEITAVRVERLQEITEEDAMKEGCEREFKPDGSVAWGAGLIEAAENFRTLWQSIYANWDANHWVWVYEFRRIKP